MINVLKLPNDYRIDSVKTCPFCKENRLAEDLMKENLPGGISSYIKEEHSGKWFWNRRVYKTIYTCYSCGGVWENSEK